MLDMHTHAPQTNFKNSEELHCATSYFHGRLGDHKQSFRPGTAKITLKSHFSQKNPKSNKSVSIKVRVQKVAPGHSRDTLKGERNGTLDSSEGGARDAMEERVCINMHPSNPLPLPRRVAPPRS